MRATVGDQLVQHGRVVGQHDKVGEIAAEAGQLRGLLSDKLLQVLVNLEGGRRLLLLPPGAGGPRAARGAMRGPRWPWAWGAHREGRV